MTTLSESVREARQVRALVTLVAPPSLGALRIVRVEVGEWPEEIVRGAKGRPITGLLSGAWVHPITLGVTTIGRGLHNDAVLLDPAVSRDHARLLRMADGWWIENISEHNALWVGAVELHAGEHAHLASGETLMLGNTTLQFLAPRTSTSAISSEPVVHPAAAPEVAADPLGSRDTPRDTPRDTSTEDAARSYVGRTGEITVLEAGATNLLGPGVTLQFALSGRFGPRARWLLGGAILLVFLLCTLLTLGLAALIGLNALAADGIGKVLAALTIPLIPALGVALLVAYLDRYEREPPLLLLAAFLWGAVIAIPPVLYIEGGLNRTLFAAFGGEAGGVFSHAASLAISAGFTEETIKGAGLLLLLWVLHDEFDNLTDGVMYGALIGAGFAMVENYVYFASAPQNDLGVLIFGRVVLGWLGHSTFTALFGAALGYARERHLRRRAWRIPLYGFLAGLLLHTLFDFVAFSAEAFGSAGGAGEAAVWIGLFTVTLDYLPLFGAQAILLRMVLAALEREAAIVREYLAAEVCSGIVTPDEYIFAQNERLRSTAERQYLLTYRLRVYITARSLYQTATGLAFRKWHVAHGDPPKATARQPEDAHRERIARLRRSLQRQLRRYVRVPGPITPATRSTRVLPRG